MPTRKVFKIIGVVQLAALLVASGIWIGFWWKDRKKSYSPEAEARWSECLTNARTLTQMIHDYTEKHRGLLPESLEAMLKENGGDPRLLLPTLVESPGEPAFDYDLAGEVLHLFTAPEQAISFRSRHTTATGKRAVAFLDGHVDSYTDAEFQAARFCTPDHRLSAGMYYPDAALLLHRAGFVRNPWPTCVLAPNMAFDFVTIRPGEELVIGSFLGSNCVTTLAIRVRKGAGAAPSIFSDLPFRTIEFPPGKSTVISFDLAAKP